MTRKRRDDHEKPRSPIPPPTQEETQEQVERDEYIERLQQQIEQVVVPESVPDIRQDVGPPRFDSHEQPFDRLESAPALELENVIEQPPVEPVNVAPLPESPASVASPPPAPEATLVQVSHEPSGKTCDLAQHYDGYGACQICKHCKTKIRPQEMNLPCPARA